MRTIILFFAFILLTLTTDYKYINGPLTRIRGYTSQAIQFTNPFSRQFFLNVPNIQDKSLFTFKPNQLILQSSYSLYMGSKTTTLLQSLRTPATQDYREIIVFDDYIIVLREANQVEILQYNSTAFIKKFEFTIRDIHQNTFYKAYKYKNKALCFANNNVYVLSNQNKYDTLVFDDSETVAYAEWIEGSDYIFLAKYHQGLGLYKVEESAKRVFLIKMFNASFFGKQFVSIQDIKLEHNSSKLFILDRFSGVHLLKYNQTNPQSIIYTTLTINQRGCYAMDSINFNYLVLSCQYETENFLTEVILYPNGTSSIMKPLFKDQYVLDVQVAPDYYLSLSRKLINVYWNSKKNHLPEQYRFSNSLVLPGLQVISLVPQKQGHDLFVISNNILTRYQLRQTGPKISFRSTTTIQRTIPVSIYGSCETINKTLITKPLDQSNQFCIYNLEYQVNIVQPNKPEKSDVSASISIIIILFVVLSILIWICIKKYTKIQEQARRMLQEFQKRNPQNHIAL